MSFGFPSLSKYLYHHSTFSANFGKAAQNSASVIFVSMLQQLFHSANTFFWEKRSFFTFLSANSDLFSKSPRWSSLTFAITLTESLRYRALRKNETSPLPFLHPVTMEAASEMSSTFAKRSAVASKSLLLMLFLTVLMHALDTFSRTVLMIFRKYCSAEDSSLMVTNSLVSIAVFLNELFGYCRFWSTIAAASFLLIGSSFLLSFWNSTWSGP
mmetsp:Transcript_19201/g.22195  ORF Transcript_19201/g.22195 Transcript_19201/m.22195 type:complete len:213 (-) Transcript_19201:2531-3169(-)